MFLENKIFEEISDISNSHENAEFIIAISAGVDSMTTLSVFKKYNDTINNIKLTAIHVNHNIDKEDDEWELFCKQQCEKLTVPLIRENVFISGDKLIDGIARTKRYQAIGKHTTKNTFIVTGHHLNDHAESVLMSLTRGTGIDGLSGIRRLRNAHYGEGKLFRPLLSLSKSEIYKYAASNGVCWVEDPSNKESVFSRNKIRNNILPTITDMYGNGVVHRIAVAASNCYSASLAIDALITQSMNTCVNWNPDFPDELPVELLSDQATAPLVFRHWLKLNGLPRMPCKALTTEAIRQLVSDFKPHNHPNIFIPTVRHVLINITRCRDTLYLTKTTNPLINK